MVTTWGLTCWNTPSGVRTVWMTWPCPWQVEQEVGVVPAGGEGGGKEGLAHVAQKGDVTQESGEEAYAGEVGLPRGGPRAGEWQ